ncbi:MAG: hypothetical protein FJ088_06115 [Deltaproteobacteria bacterium]|nr:hypothetical protein [Deltaproteobacteria bacterium]
MCKLKRFDIIGIILIFVSPVILLETTPVISGVYRLWPLIPLVFGIGSVLLFFKSGRNDSLMFGFGVYFIMLSVFFLYLNYTSWDRLSYLWPVFILLIGLAFLFLSLVKEIRLIRFFGLVFSLAGIACISVFSISYSLWPLSLALFGIVILLINHLPDYLKKKGDANG